MRPEAGYRIFVSSYSFKYQWEHTVNCCWPFPRPFTAKQIVMTIITDAFARASSKITVSGKGSQAPSFVILPSNTH